MHSPNEPVKQIIEKARKNKEFIFAVTVFFILANLFSLYFISRERNFYEWDLLNYWKKFIYLTNPIFDGFVDLGGIFLINLILLQYLKSHFSKQKIRTLLFIAILIPILVLFRRWYAFWAVSFYAVLFMEICITSFLTFGFDIKKF